MITADTITDEMCRAVVALMPFDREHNLLDGALGVTEPHRNHSRHELAKLWVALACESCTLRYLGGNHPAGCIFVGWGHGWQPCQRCGGSGLSPMGNDLSDRKCGAAYAQFSCTLTRGHVGEHALASAAEILNARAKESK